LAKRGPKAAIRGYPKPGRWKKEKRGSNASPTFRTRRPNNLLGKENFKKRG